MNFYFQPGRWMVITSRNPLGLDFTKNLPLVKDMDFNKNMPKFKEYENVSQYLLDNLILKVNVLEFNYS
jgi:hypothetical protein